MINETRLMPCRTFFHSLLFSFLSSFEFCFYLSLSLTNVSWLHSLFNVFLISHSPTLPLPPPPHTHSLFLKISSICISVDIQLLISIAAGCNVPFMSLSLSHAHALARTHCILLSLSLPNEPTVI